MRVGRIALDGAAHWAILRGDAAHLLTDAPWIEPLLSPDDLSVATEVSGTPRAAGRTSDTVFSTGRLLAFISSVMTLNPGDVVTTGTPPGVAPIHHGDTVHVVIEGIGTMTNPVVNRSDRPL